MCLSVGLFEFILLAVCEWSIGVLRFISFITFGKSSANFFKDFLCPFLFIFSFWESTVYRLYWSAYWCPTNRLGSVHFNPFSLFYRLNNFHFPSFKFADSSFCLSKTALNSPSECFILVIVLLTLEFFFYFFLEFLLTYISILFTHWFLKFLHFF